MSKQLHPKTVEFMERIRPIIEARYQLPQKFAEAKPMGNRRRKETPITPARPAWLDDTRYNAPFQAPVVKTHFRVGFGQLGARKQKTGRAA